MWNRLSLRNRILVSYAIILALMLAFAISMIIQLRGITDHVSTLQSELSASVQATTQVATDIADIRQAVNNYLRNPSPTQQAQVGEAIRAIGQSLSRARSKLPPEINKNQLGEIRPLVAGYEQTFQTLVSLTERQQNDLLQMKQQLAEMNGILSELEQTLHVGQVVSPQSDAALSAASQSLQNTTLIIIGLSQENAATQAQQAADGLRKAATTMEAFSGEASDQKTKERITALQRLMGNTAISIVAYASNMNLQTTYESQLQLKDRKLRDAASALTQSSELLLTTTTGSLSKQLWETQQLAMIAMALNFILAVALAFGLSHTITRPLQQVVDAIQQVEQHSSQQQIVTKDQGEVGKLAQAFNQMVIALSDERASVRSQQSALSNRNAELEQALHQIQRANEERDILTTTIQNLSVPIIPILKQVLLVPLVGELDQSRAEVLTDRLLQQITIHRARLIILDVTGVPLIDSLVAEWLIHSITSARLLGASATMVGITPEVAQTLVASGIDFATMRTQADLRTAIEAVIRNQN